MTQKIIILDNIRSAHNVGSIFRTADGAGVEKIYLLGCTPSPIDRFGRKQPEIAKTSLGASDSIPFECIENMGGKKLIDSLKQEGFTVVAMELTPSSISLYDFVVPQKVCYILGNEVEGVGKELLDLADTVVEIPMSGLKESLNVSVTAGIALFHKGG